MKSRILLASILALLIVVSAPSVTRIGLSFLAAPASGSGFALVVTPAGVVSVATLGSGLTLNTATSPPTLSATLPAQPKSVSSNIVVTGASQTWATPGSSCPVLMVEWNGVTLNSGVDYTVGTGGGSITIATSAGTVLVGDTIQMQCIQ
jgi:hypothetical protein